MNFFLLVVAIVIAFWLWKKHTALRGAKLRDANLLKALEPLISQFEKGEKPDNSLIVRLSENHAQRLLVWQLLEARERLDLFPSSFKNREAGALANLCYWLCHPNELGCVPDKIEFLQKVNFPTPDPDVDAEYLVFKFGMEPPHWLSKSGWRVGIAGPYFLDTPDYAFTPGTCSRFDPIAEKSLEEHARWAHEEMVVKKGFFN